MNDKQAIKYIKDLGQYGSSLGLDRMKALLEYLGNPQDNIHVIHIAGTNGKGSVTSYITSILIQSGYKTGTYTSPAISDFQEMIQVNGYEIDKKELVACINLIKSAIEDMLADGLQHPTEFEVITALAFLCFKESQCDFIVLETGLGGRYDATNVMEATTCCVITAIGMDHTNFLGDSIEKIAYQKAGIIKPNSEVVLYQQNDTIMEVIRTECQENKAKLHIAEVNDYSLLETSYKGQVFSYKAFKEMRIHLLGKHQIKNAITAIEVANVLINKGFHMDEESIKEGLAKARWPYRFEIVSENPFIVLDGAHNVQAAQALRQSIEAYFPEKNILFIFGVFKDKDYKRILEITAPLADTIITVTPNHQRALSSKEGAIIAKQFCSHVINGDTIENAVKISLELAKPDDVIIGFGSLSYLSALKNTWHKTIK
ncbi:bifunctional folylpolyglutamate synthase/dihydrofolate synthase [Vallitalea pronyensis]|uniref:tetrahydrofolate synthase n=1 Tax=Vallitalea pronyensis TaxID=1348613 RepID=A0A8J8ML79_9FIRM|nr:folylpolyglutamate synthase/dihydrofolate synthase family protein [Vallitalea pronyensis]QUI23556.1 bifunctional folylpolyglutamate synthase/dihydrofolate synthase [Vallitalea pronyensis]